MKPGPKMKLSPSKSFSKNKKIRKKNKHQRKQHQHHAGCVMLLPPALAAAAAREAEKGQGRVKEEVREMAAVLAAVGAPKPAPKWGSPSWFERFAPIVAASVASSAAWARRLAPPPPLWSDFGPKATAKRGSQAAFCEDKLVCHDGVWCCKICFPTAAAAAKFRAEWAKSAPEKGKRRTMPNAMYTGVRAKDCRAIVAHHELYDIGAPFWRSHEPYVYYKLRIRNLQSSLMQPSLNLQRKR